MNEKKYLTDNVTCYLSDKMRHSSSSSFLTFFFCSRANNDTKTKDFEEYFTRLHVQTFFLYYHKGGNFELWPNKEDLNCNDSCAPPRSELFQEYLFLQCPMYSHIDKELFRSSCTRERQPPKEDTFYLSFMQVEQQCRVSCCRMCRPISCLRAIVIVFVLPSFTHRILLAPFHLESL